VLEVDVWQSSHSTRLTNPKVLGSNPSSTTFFFAVIRFGKLFLQYSSQVTSLVGTREYHNGAPREAPMLTCHTQGLRVTASINTSHASVFSRQQGPRKDQPAPRPAEHSSLHPIVASHLRIICLGL